jgi:hypothetical protein
LGQSPLLSAEIWFTAADEICFAHMKKTLWRSLSLFGLVFCGLLAGGCATHYYCVTDTASGKSYFTPKIRKDKKTGAVSFLDARSGAYLVVPTNQVRQIKRPEFNQALYAK